MNEEQTKRRQEWLDMLEACVYHHTKEANKTAPVILMQSPSEDHIMHKAFAMAVKEALDLITILPTIDDDDDGMPQHRVGPAG